MKACGVSLYRAAVSVVLLSLVFSGDAVRARAGVLAKANRRADVLDAQIRGRPPRLFDAMNRQWVVGPRRERLPLQLLQPGAGRDVRPGDLPAATSELDACNATFAENASRGTTAGRPPRLGPGLQVEPADLDAVHEPDPRPGSKRPTTSRPSSRLQT